MPQTFPAQARVVIIGGGIVGCSVAYHLAQMGCHDVVLIEQYQLTAGSTWHAAGAVGQLRSSANVTRLLSDSVALYATLEQETGQPTGWKQNGSLRLASTKERQSEFEVAATVARSFGIELHMLSQTEVHEMVPQMKVDDLVCAAYVPSDGIANPSDITQALAKGARKGGVKIAERTRVLGFGVENGSISSVETDKGTIQCDSVVNCAGIWAREVGRMAGVNVPLQPSHHQYFVTEKIEGFDRDIPTVRDTDHQLYFKEEVGGLAVGAYEFKPIPFLQYPIPEDHEYKLMQENIDQFEPMLIPAYERFPALETTGVKQWFNGVESFTEDGMFIMGEAPEIKGFYVGAGFNAFGIAAGGGAGKALAHWVLHGEPPFDLWSADIRRFAPYHRSSSQVLQRSLEGQGHHYTMHWPHEEPEACRNLRVSPIYHRLKQNGASFGTKFGWERANWFAPSGIEPRDVYSFDRQNWFEHTAIEHHACRNNAGLFDQSSFAKFRMFGKDAESVLQTICAGNISQDINKVIYTPLLNDHGGIEADLTITRTGDDKYMIVTGTGSATRDFSFLQRRIPDGADARLFDITSAYGCLSLMGPKAREVLGPVAEGDISNDGFPLGTAKDIIISGAPVYALRVAFVGELGWELYVPSEYMVHVYDALKESGTTSGLADCGYRAIDSLRLEKARRLWGHEIGPDYTPLEAGLGFAVDMKKPTFNGRTALEDQRANGVSRKLVSFTIDNPDVVIYGKETIFRNGEHVGWLTSGGYGHTIGKPLGMGYVRHSNVMDSEFLSSGKYELEVRTRRIPANIHLRPVYDPGNERPSS
jgi:sarcosine dehydrogenase